MSKLVLAAEGPSDDTPFDKLLVLRLEGEAAFANPAHPATQAQQTTKALRVDSALRFMETSIT
jgi:hypothetical protein